MPLIDSSHSHILLFRYGARAQGIDQLGLKYSIHFVIAVCGSGDSAIACGNRLFIAPLVIGDSPRILSCAIGPRELIKGASAHCFENK